METVETTVPLQEAALDPEEIRTRAYELSLQHPEDSPMDNWLRAESELLTTVPDVRLYAPVGRVSRQT